MRRSSADGLQRLLGGVAIASAWATYLPLGSKYAVYLGSTVLAIVILVRTRQLGAVFRWPPFLAPLALWLLLVASLSWTSAPRSDALSHLWHYGRMLLMPMIAMALAPADARRALMHFVAASAIVGTLASLDRLQLLPLGDLLVTTIAAEGNQRIVTSLLLAIGAALALLQSWDGGGSHRHRVAWICAAMPILLGLSLQDRRTGMVTLPVLLVVLVMARQGTWRQGVMLLFGLGLVGSLVWQASSTIRGRFAEGLAEIRSYQAQGPVATSWGMRLRMADLSFDMIRERPVLGHGTGSWKAQWAQRVKGDGDLLEKQTTPHNEYLLIATQLGVIGLYQWMVILVVYFRSAWQAGRAGDAALLVWTAIAWSAQFSVAIRDAKFAMPLLLIAALALAASQHSARRLNGP